MVVLIGALLCDDEWLCGAAPPACCSAAASSMLHLPLPRLVLKLLGELLPEVYLKLLGELLPEVYLHRSAGLSRGCGSEWLWRQGLITGCLGAATATTVAKCLHGNSVLRMNIRTQSGDWCRRPPQNRVQCPVKTPLNPACQDHKSVSTTRHACSRRTDAFQV